MGDGRYYTFYQFYIIVFMTLFLISISISGVLFFYQDFKKNNRLIGEIHLFLGVAALLRFSEEVLVSREIGYMLKTGEIFCIILTFCLFFSLRSGKSKTNRVLYKFSVLFSISSIVIFFVNPSWLIKDYTLYQFQFGIGYAALVFFWLFYWVVSLWQLRKKIHTIVIFILPLLIHFISVVLSTYDGDLSFLLIYPACLAGINYLTSNLKEYQIGNQVFSNINNLVQDAILICDTDDNIIYKNRHATESPYLRKDIKTIPWKNHEKIFEHQISKSRKYDIEIFSPKNKEIYLECRTHKIHRANNEAGRSIIVSDITERIHILDMQAQQKEHLEKANHRLNQYSKIVFDLEKEREISGLLTEMTKKQKRFMEKFKKKIKELSICYDQRQFNTQVDKLIKDAEINLSNIRETVARYRRFYGKKN